ncbi:MAG: glycosyl transferase family 1 [Chromatiales bacterium 21-64-14]|nr:MAG: glycosyl transferase family 1 [Chromatiales bacterium 21-64-14]HQU17114.1 glycosyltransferase family 4 protein [Gammaproteobacteria bacterium]
MKVLFVHQTFPGQYLHLARYLGAQAGNEVVFITQRKDGALPGVRKIIYRPHRAITPHVHHYLRETEAAVINAQQVARAAVDLKASGFVPDVMLGHNGWGEIWYLKDIFPTTPLIGYFEFFYRSHGADVGFDPNDPALFDTAPRIRTKNLGNLLALDSADLGQCPTRWQHSLYPALYHPKLHIVHEGINTRVAVPNAGARLKLPNGHELTPADEVVTYVARNLEPYRGFPSFMRSLPAVLEEHPRAQAVIIGGDETSYGPQPPNGQTYKQQMLAELGDTLDRERVHFLGKVPYPTLLTALQVSSAHVYLTFPFVLSWSMLEAMACGCLVIGSRTPPVMEVIEENRNGLLVDFFSPEAIAGKIVSALKDPATYTQLREHARRTVVENYDLDSKCLPAQLGLLKTALESATLRA